VNWMRLTERRRELFHRQGDTYQKERLVICNEDADGRAIVTVDEERILLVD